MADGNRLVLTRVLPASREMVFAAWTEEALIKQWFCPEEGMTVPVADCSAAPALFYAEQAAPFAGYKNISAYWERLKQRPSVQRTHEEARPVLEAFMSKNAA